MCVPQAPPAPASPGILPPAARHGATLSRTGPPECARAHRAPRPSRVNGGAFGFALICITKPNSAAPLPHRAPVRILPSHTLRRGEVMVAVRMGVQPEMRGEARWGKHDFGG